MSNTAHALPATTSETLEASAFTLFGRFGYDGVSMTTVARACGITKAGLYWHYSSKQALYADCMRRLVGLFEHHLLATAITESDPIEQIFAVFSGLISLVDDPRLVDGVAGYWLRPATADVVEARQAQADFQTMAQAAVEDILARAAATGDLTLTLPVTDVARAFIALVEAIVLPLGNREAVDHRRMVGVLAHIFFKAYAQEPALARRAEALITGAPTHN